MGKHIFYCFLLCCASVSFSQELDSRIIVDSEQVNQTNQQIFKTLENSLNDFVNKNKWTNRVVKENERISVNMLIVVTNFESDRFEANIQLQSTRTVFNTTYESPVFNYKDDAFNFRYQEFEPLVYNPNSFDSNLVAVISYYVYIILGMDADTFALQGGSEYYRLAQNIVSQAQSFSGAGWSQNSSGRNRFELVDDLLSNAFKEYRQALYNYHRKGLDVMTEDLGKGKKAIASSIKLFETLIKRRPNAFLTQTFFEAKSEEIQNVFSDGPKVDIVKLKSSLNKVAPFYSNIWNDISY